MTYNVFLDSACVNCKPNSILGSRVYKYLVRNNHVIERSLPRADYVIISTCGFNDFHEKLSARALAVSGRRKKPGAKVISIGCLNKINADAVKAAWPEAVIVSDLNELDRIFCDTVRFAEINEACLDDHQLSGLWASSDRCFEFFDKVYLSAGRVSRRLLRFRPAIQARIGQALDEAYKRDKVFVEIAQGCLNHCSYCVIKKAKGELRSRPVEDILSDIRRVHAPGKNLYLVAEDCGGYGLDMGEDIFSLLYAIGREYPALGIDLCYINPVWLEKKPREYIELFRTVRINSVNVSMQSGADDVIRRMNRKYSVGKVLDIIRELRRVSPGTLFWTHVIIGFPGETHADFLKTLSLVEDFDLVSKFLYSDRQGTPSAAMRPKVPRRVKLFRCGLLRVKELAVYGRRVFSGTASCGAGCRVDSPRL